MRQLSLIIVQHPAAVVALWLAIALLGMVSLYLLPVEMHPRLELPQVTVVTEVHGMPADQVEQLVTIPVEQSLTSVTGIRSLESVSRHAISAVRVHFDWGVRVRDVAVQIRERIDAVYPLLPQAASRPLIFSERLDDTPIMIVTVRPTADLPLQSVLPLIESEVVATLRQAAQIGAVTVLGSVEPQIHVDVDPERLASIGMTIRELSDLVAVALYQHSAGSLVGSEIEMPVRIDAGIDHVAGIEAIPLPRPIHGPTVADVARVSMATRPRTSFFLNPEAEPAVALLLFRDPAHGTLNSARAARTVTADIGSRLNNSLELAVVHDGSLPLRRALRALAASIGFGIAAAVIVLYRLLRIPALVTISVCAIPFSLLLVFIMLYALGMTLNLMSLSGIAIGIGMVVDNSIVVLERITRSEQASSAVQPQPVLIAEAVDSVCGPILGSTLTTLLVFVPVLFVPGVVGALFSQLALVISALLVCSFLCAVTLVPALTLLLPRAAIPASYRPVARCRDGYRRLLGSALSRPRRTAAFFGLVVAAAVPVAVMLPRSVLPQAPPRRIAIRMALSPHASICRTEHHAAVLLKELSQLLPSSTAYAYGGYERTAVDRFSRPGVGTHAAEVILTVSSPAADTLRRVRDALAALSGPHAAYQVSAAQTEMETLLTGPPGPPRLQLSAASHGELSRAAELLVSGLSGDNGVRRPLIDGAQQRSHLVVKLDVQAAAMSGVSARSVIGQFQNELDGIDSGRLAVAGREYGVVVRRAPERASAPSDLEAILIGSGTGSVAAGSLARIEHSRTVHELRRLNGRPMLELVAPVSPDEAHVVLQLALQAEDAGNAESGRARVDGGRARIDGIHIAQASVDQLRRAGDDILRVFGLALVLQLLMLAAQFGSLRSALLLLALLPAAVSGSLATLLLLGHSINLNTVIGTLVMLGTSVNASIILTCAYRDDPGRCIITVTEQRLMPILATTVTTVAALGPLALDLRPDSVAQSGMAAAVIGGLITGALTTLLLYPVLYQQLVRNVRQTR